MRLSDGFSLLGLGIVGFNLICDGGVRLVTVNALYELCQICSYCSVPNELYLCCKSSFPSSYKPPS